MLGVAGYLVMGDVLGFLGGSGKEGWDWGNGCR
jgi:hypothetical protein